MFKPGDDFDWELFANTGTGRLIPNTDIKGPDNNKEKVYCHERYAQRAYDLYAGQKNQVIKKDLTRGDCVPITDIFNIKEAEFDIELSGGLSINIDLNREKRFVQIFGFESVEDFTNALHSNDYKKGLLNENLIAYVIESSPNIKVSLWQGYLVGIRAEFMEEIHNPSQAYTAKIMEANKGGFFVEVQGIEAFMPGSLAAANKINDFQSLVGKEVIVMVEDFLKDMNSFIVSHKKYISHILPQKIRELDTMKRHNGKVTGTSKYGIFIEFGEIFTGLLHVSKMEEETLNKFKARLYKAGDDIGFYIGEITKDNRIILTEEDPHIKLQKIQKFIFENQDKPVESEIVAIMKFGVIVSTNEITGLVPLKEFKQHKVFINNFMVKDKLNVVFDEFRDDKIVFRLPEKID